MHFTTTCYAERFCGFGLINMQGNVLEGLFKQTVTQMTGGQELTFLACKWAVVNREGHLNSWSGNLYKFQWFWCIWRTDGFTDAQVFNTGDTNDIADCCALSLNSLQALDLIEGYDLGAIGNIWIVVIAYDNWIVYFQSTSCNSADTDSADKVVVVDGRNQHLCRAFRITFWCWDFFQDGVKQNIQIFAFHTWLTGSGSFFTGAVQNFAFELFFVCIQIKQKVINFLGYFFVSCIRTVSLVYYDDNLVTQRKCFGQYKTGLRHWTFERVNQQDNTVYHFEDTLNLAAEVCMSWGVNDVDLCAFIVDCSILCKDGDTSFTFKVTVIHDTVLNRLVVTEGTALFEHLVNQGGLTMVYVRDDCDVS